MSFIPLKFKLNHKDWTDYITVDIKTNIIKRINDMQDGGTFIQNNNIIIIFWDSWSPDLFYTYGNEEITDIPIFYQITFNNKFKLHHYISFYHIVDINNSDLYIYDFNTLTYYSITDINISYQYDDIIYFNNIFYTKDFFNNIFEKINICKKNDDEISTINKDILYIISKNDNICYEIEQIDNRINILKSGFFIKIFNKYKLIFDNETIFLKYNYSSETFNIYINPNLNKILYINDLKKNINTLYFINRGNINNIIKLIQYYSYFKYDTVLVDDICNIKNNDLYDDITIYYYKDVCELIDFELIEYKESDFITEQKDNFLKIDNSINDLNFELNITKHININKIWIENNSSLKLNKYTSIPKIIHFIWIGEAPLPPSYEYYISSWINNHPDWIFCFWNDYNKPILINEEIYNLAKYPAMKADILRYELLYFIGGVYIDTDFLSIKNIDELLKNIDGFTGFESDDYMAIGLMGFKPLDPILYQIIIQIPYNIIHQNSLLETGYETFIPSNSIPIPKLTGPVFFTYIWDKYKTNLHKAFKREYFYSYSFEEKHQNKKFIIKNTNYAIHMWGYSWESNNIDKNKKNNSKNIVDNKYYIRELFLQNYVRPYFNTSLYSNNNIDNEVLILEYKNIDNYLKNNIFYKSHFKNLSNPILEKKNYNKLRVVHIMGLFFTGGIERYLYYLSKYGDHEKYNYYLFHISNNNQTNKSIYSKYSYLLKNIIMIDFQWDHIYLNNILLSIRPDLIIDHYSIYLNDNNDIYNGIDRTRVIHFVHSALCYKKYIEKLRFLKCIHLYIEKEKEISWNNIKYNYYTTLGTEIIDIDDFDKKTFSEKEILNISIVGRIAEEKNPISFFKKLCESLLLKNNNLKICIYGEKDYVFNKKYVIQFEEILDSFNSRLNKTNNTINYFEFRRDTTEIYKNTDLLLIPSVYETGSFSCLEAFSWGIPVIARNVYGLPYLINHGIEGYLFNTDDEIIDKLLNIKKTDVIFKNREHIIKRVRDKFNIFSKIKDLENIIDENIETRNKTNNIIFITSIINCCNKPLSYYHIRSVFDVKTRFLQTLKTIESIRLKIPNSIIFLFECSDLNIILEEEEHTIETNIKEKVDYYYNFYENDIIRDAVNSSLKGLGEANLLIAGLDKMQEIIEKNNIDYEYLFKISGRYYLNHDFKISDFENSNNNFIQWDNSLCSYSTIFYKIYYYDVSLYKKALLDMMDDLKKENSIECCIYKYFKKRIQVMQKMNVSGLLATEGYLFSV